MVASFKDALDQLMARLGHATGFAEKTKRNPTVAERQVIRRRQLLIEGYLCSERLILPRPCSVRDLSHFGSRVELWDDIPASKLDKGLTLYLPCDHKEVDCDLSWIEGRSVGLRFRTGFHEPTRHYH